MTLPPNLDPSTWNPAITIVSYHLDNGLKLMVLPDHGVPVVSLQVHYQVGSKNELPGITGISHLFEHLMFRGTKELGPEEFARLLQSKGGEINAFTTKDHTSYFENLPAEHLELALRLEADRLLNLNLDEENFQTEREVVISERKLRSVDSPFGLVEEQLFATAYTQHPYAWPVIGWNQDLRRLTLADCLAFYRAYYHPGNLTLVIAGDVDPEAARDLVIKYFGHLASPGPPTFPKVVEPPQRGERRAVFKKVSQVEAFLAGFHLVGLDHPDIYPLTLLEVVLSGGRASRLYQEFVRPGRVADLEAYLAPPPWSAQDPDLFLFRAVAAPGADLARLETDLWNSLERLQEEGVEEAELARAQKILKAQMVQGLAKNFFRGLLAGLFQLKTGDAQRLNDILGFYDAVRREDLSRVTREYLHEDNRTVVILKPVSPEESQALGTLS
jgi:zinc protease